MWDVFCHKGAPEKQFFLFLWPKRQICGNFMVSLRCTDKLNYEYALTSSDRFDNLQQNPW